MATADRVSATSLPALVSIERLVLDRGARRILSGVNLQIAAGELVALMGPSGSGKTTILRALAGLEGFQAGRIVVDDVELVGGTVGTRSTLARLRRKVGMVFQFHCLFDHLTVTQNICLAPVHALKVGPGSGPHPRARTARGFWGRASRRGPAARTLGWRSATRRNRARARSRTPSPTDGRTDRIAGSRTARRARGPAAQPDPPGPYAAPRDARRGFHAGVRYARRADARRLC